MRDLTDSEAEAIFIRVLAIETSLLELRAELKELAEVVAETKEAVKSLSNICRRDRVRFPDAREERAGKLMKPRLLGHLEVRARPDRSSRSPALVHRYVKLYCNKGF